MFSCCEKNVMNVQVRVFFVFFFENCCDLQCKNQQTVKLHRTYVHPQHQLKECQRHHRRGLVPNLTTP